MSNHEPTRRRLLTAAAAAPLAAVPALALAAPGDDARLVQLYAEWCALLREEKEGEAEYERCNARLPDWAKPGEDQAGNFSGWPDLRRSPDWERLFGASGLSWRESEAQLVGWNAARIIASKRGTPERRQAEAEGAERLRAFNDVQEAKEREEAAAGVTAYEEASEALCDRLFEIEGEIVRTPVQGLAGLLVKIRIMAWIEWETRPDDPLPAVADDKGCRDLFLPSIALDVERLAGRAAA